MRTIEIFNLWGSISLKGADQASKDIENLDNKAEKSEGVLSKLGNTGAKFGAFVAKGAAAASVGLAGLVAMSDNAQKAFNGLQASTGATDKEMKGMEKSLKNIYKNNYGESFGDIAESMANVKQNTGLAGSELENLTQSALMLRDTFQFEVEESTKAADTMMKQFGVTGEEAMTLIAQGAQQGANKSGDLLDTINEYAPQFKAVGMDAEFMMDTLITGAQNGAFSIDKVGDAVKEMNIRMKDGNKDTISALSSIGLNASEVTKAFAEGGEVGQQAFIDVMNALSNVDDPMKKNIAGVAIMGTQYEDLEGKAIDALADIGLHTDMTGDTLKKIDSIKYNTITEAIKGVGRNLYISILEPIQAKMMPAMNDFTGKFITLIEASKKLASGDIVGFSEIVTKAFGQENGLKIMSFAFAIQSGMEKVKEYIDIGKDAIKALFEAFKGNEGAATSIMTRLGMDREQIQQVLSFVEQFKAGLKTLSDFLVSAFTTSKQVVSDLFAWLGPFVMPIVNEVFGFIKNQLSVLQTFWKENGDQIMLAVQNAFNFIMSVINFAMPFILLLIQSVWGSIKGVISGALDVIMGLVKVFTGIFTGDFSMMWEGIKQLFFGALEFLWNLFNLMMIGKLLGGFKAFVLGGVNFFKSFATTSVATFKQFIDDVITWFNYFRQTGSSIWRALVDTIKNLIQTFKNAVKTNFDSMFNNVKSVFGKIKDAITNPIKTAKDTVKGFVDEIKGFFSNMKLKLPKIKMPHFKIKNWSSNPKDWLKAIPSLGIDWYAKGTNFATGGLAMVGERGPELVELPRGSKVKTNEETKQMMGNQPSQNITYITVEGNIDRDLYDEIMTEQDTRLNTKLFFSGVKGS